MVYCGRPSRGCENCRKLHKKCDEKYPQCSRCVKTGKTCSGYRDQSKLLFRDETTKTKEKILRKKSDESTRNWGVKNASTPLEAITVTLFMTPHRPLLPSKESIAICNFYHNTTENLSVEDPTLYLHNQLSQLYFKSNQGSVLHLALEAVSYAASTKILPEANQLSGDRYLKAVRALRETIQDKTRNSDDQTLYSVLLLCGYETMTGQSCMPSAWGAHVDGAQALMKLRANSSDTALSRSLFSFIRKNVVMSQMQICQPVDDIFTQDVVCEDPENRLISLAARIPELQHQSSHLEQLDIKEIEQLVYNANRLDFDLSAWATNIPPSWSYATALNINGHADSEYSPRVVHRYTHFYTARVWNFYRVSRLVLQSICFRAVFWLPETDTSHIEKRIAGLVDDICATVPYLLGQDLSKMKLHFNDKEDSTYSASSAVRMNGDAGKFTIIWPLYVASSAPSIPLTQKRWMRRQLHLLAEDGIPLAKSVCAAESQIFLGRPEMFRFDCV